MPGRKRKLNEVRQSEICALLSAGYDMEHAAEYVGCTSVTVRREMDRDPDFLGRVEKARSSPYFSPLQAMRNAAKTHWRAAAWLLERTEPEKYARATPHMLKVVELAKTCEQIVNVIGDEIEDPETLSRIEGRVTEVMSNVLCESWLPAACDDQLRAAPPERPQPKKSACAEPQFECRTAGAQNETQSPPILSDALKRNDGTNGLFQCDGSTE